MTQRIFPSTGIMEYLQHHRHQISVVTQPPIVGIRFQGYCQSLRQ